MKATVLLAAICRWTARLGGASFLALILAMAIGEGLPNPLTQPPTIQVGLPALLLLLAGMVLGWVTELWGGLLSLAGWLIFVTATQLYSWHTTIFVSLLCLPGLLFLVAAIARRAGHARLEGGQL